MGFFDSIVDALSGKSVCPVCRLPGGSPGPSGSFRCLNPLCKNFDPTLLGGVASPPAQAGPSSTSPTPAAPVVAAPAASGWTARPAGTSPPPSGPGGAPGGGTVEIRYVNHAGEEKRFTADVASLHRVKDHISARVQPKRATISLARKRIRNLADVEGLMPARVAPGQDWPSARERQVLSYHRKHGSTSPLFERIRAKYPKW